MNGVIFTQMIILAGADTLRGRQATDHAGDGMGFH